MVLRQPFLRGLLSITEMLIFLVDCLLSLFGILCLMLDKLGGASAIQAILIAFSLHKFSWTIACYAPAMLSQNLLKK